MKSIRVLFICKNRTSYGVSYGLLNSCKFLCNALIDMGYEAKVVSVIDNNGIDREVFNYKPTHVFIEALWVVPEKFEVLIPRYPNVQWYVRLHSNTPFISNEGMAIDWVVKYFALGVKYPQFKVAPNSIRMMEDLKGVFGVNTVYTPNIYLPGFDAKPTPPKPQPPHVPKTINVGCFGAIRPLKNQLIQAMAAITFANEMDMQLNYHINVSRIEGKGEPILKNIESLFATTRHKLQVYEWMPHQEFVALVSTMDVGLQVSFSETFNIVAADFAYANVPIVGSTEIEWMSPLFKADPTSLEDIVCHLKTAYNGRKFGLQIANRMGLKKWNDDARHVWKKLLN